MSAQPTILEGAYRLLKPAGSGGTAKVYQAEDTKTGQKVAVKVLRKELASHADFVARFHREAALLAQVRHPNLVHLIRFADAPEGMLLVLEWIEGIRLDVRLKESPVLGVEALRILVHVAEALAALHQQGVVHRDLKPENIILENRSDGPFARLLDLGIARPSDAKLANKGFVTLQGQVAGTPTYLSPEQILARPATTRADVYTFGVLAYVLVTGKPPFHSENSYALLQDHLNSPAPTPVPLDPSLAKHAVLGLIRRCLEKAPEDRPQDGQALVAALTGRSLAPTDKRKWWSLSKPE